METLIVLSLVVVMLAMASKVGVQFFKIRNNIENIDEIVTNNLKDRAHFIVMQHIKAYSMPDNMEKIHAIRRCKELVIEYEIAFAEERTKLESKSVDGAAKILWFKKSA